MSGVRNVPRRGYALDEEALRTYLAERLVHYKLPGTMRFVGDLPRTSVGKIDKIALRRQI